VSTVEPFEPFAYSPIIERRPIRWPNDARVAFWIVPNVEFYEFEPHVNLFKPAWRQVPDVRNYSWRDYGNRVGFWRMLDVLDHHAVPITASLNMGVLDMFPEVADAMVSRDWELMSHGLFNTHYLSGMSEDEERALIEDTMDTHRRHTGREMKGMFGPAATLTTNTMDLMAEAGLIYSADWYADDQPFPLRTKSGRLVCVPYTWELNDGLCMTEGFAGGLGTHEADYFLQICKDQFDVLYEEGAESGRVMCIALHTSIFGAPHRVRYLDEALEYILGHDGVWATTADKIAEHYLNHNWEGAAR
jgi:allantoinase